MTNWVSVSSAFSWRTHSMPLSPGRLISISTTAGFSCGNFTSALSALPCSLTEAKPSARRIQLARMCRAGASSSIIETEISTTLLTYTSMVKSNCHQFSLHRHINWHGKSYFCPCARGALDVARAADFFQSLAHILQPVPLGDGPWAMTVVRLGQIRRHATTIILDREHEGIRLHFEQDLHFGSGGVFDHVVQRFLEGKEKVVTHLCGQRPNRK